MCKNSDCTFSDTITNPLVLQELGRYDDLSPGQDDVVRHHDSSDIHRVSPLGKGAYCDVSLVVLNSTKEQLAMKTIDQKKIRTPEDFLTAAPDLIMEAHYLSQLDHPNVIKLRGVSALSFSESFTKDKKGYFLTLDVMEETLESRLRRWRKDSSCYKKRAGIYYPLAKKSKKVDVQRMYGRLETVALGIADAMEYIHGKSIVVNDLKPANVGFHAETGKVCLFDFGFAKDLTICTRDEICGTPRYMAPEVLRGEEGPSLKSDVYSFGLLLHELASLCRKEIPKKNSPVSNHSDLIDAIGSLSELSLRVIPCPKVASLIQSCISDDPERRPSFAVIAAELRAILADAATTQNKAFGLTETLDKCSLLPSTTSVLTESESTTLDTFPDQDFNELSKLRNVQW